MVIPSHCGPPVLAMFSSPGRNSVGVVAGTGGAGQTPLRVNPISGTSLIPACNGCVPRRHSRGLNRGRASTLPSVRLYGVSPGSGVVMLVPVLCRGATVTLRHHSSLAGLVPPGDYAMTLFRLSSPDDGGGSLRRASYRLLTLLTRAGPEWIRGSRQATGRKAYPRR